MIFFTIIESIRKSDKLKRLYDKYGDMMYNAAYSIVKEKQLAEDSVQDSFMIIKNKLDQIDEDNPKRTAAFLVIICRNAAKKIYNRQIPLNQKDEWVSRITNEEANIVANPSDIMVSNDTVHKIYEAIDTLDEKYRDVFLLKHVYNYSREDMAYMLGVNKETVKKRLFRAKAMIIDYLKKEGYYEN